MVRTTLLIALAATFVISPAQAGKFKARSSTVGKSGTFRQRGKERRVRTGPNQLPHHRLTAPRRIGGLAALTLAAVLGVTAVGCDSNRVRITIDAPTTGSPTGVDVKFPGGQMTVNLSDRSSRSSSSESRGRGAKGKHYKVVPVIVPEGYRGNGGRRRR